MLKTNDLRRSARKPRDECDFGRAFGIGPHQCPPRTHGTMPEAAFLQLTMGVNLGMPKSISQRSLPNIANCPILMSVEGH